MRYERSAIGVVLLFLGTWGGVLWADEDSKKNPVRAGLQDDVADFWIYDDLQAGFREAQRTGEPLLVSLRCVP